MKHHRHHWKVVWITIDGKDKASIGQCECGESEIVEDLVERLNELEVEEG